MQKDSFILYKSFYEPLKMLSDKQLGKLFKAIFEYQINDCISVDPDIQMAFAFIKNQMDLDNVKYQEKVRKNKENGQRGGRPPKKDITIDKPNGFYETQKSERLFMKPKKPYNDNEYDNEYDNDILLEKESKGIQFSQSVDQENNLKNNPPLQTQKEKQNNNKFSPPSIQEVQQYFKEKGYSQATAIKAFNYYDVAKWKDSKGNQVKNWKQKMISVWFKDENKIIQETITQQPIRRKL